jgi:hypothetical protein
MERPDPDDRIPVRCSVCRWITYFSVEVIHEVWDETRWICEVCAPKDWDGFTTEADPFPSKR